MHSKPGKLVPFTAVGINRVESVAKFGGGIFVGNGSTDKRDVLPVTTQQQRPYKKSKDDVMHSKPGKLVPFTAVWDQSGGVSCKIRRWNLCREWPQKAQKHKESGTISKIHIVTFVLFVVNLHFSPSRTR